MKGVINMAIVKGAEFAGSVSNAGHSMELHDRAKMTLTGVTDVSEFSDSAVKLKTNMGAMTVKGEGLTISRLNTNDGDVEINGSINSIQYQTKQKTGFWDSLLK